MNIFKELTKYKLIKYHIEQFLDDILEMLYNSGKRHIAHIERNDKEHVKPLVVPLSDVTSFANNLLNVISAFHANMYIDNLKKLFVDINVYHLIDEFEKLIAKAYETESQEDLKALADWFLQYNNYDYGGEFYNIDGSRGLKIITVEKEDGTTETTYKLINFDDLDDDEDE